MIQSLVPSPVPCCSQSLLQVLHGSQRQRCSTQSQEGSLLPQRRQTSDETSEDRGQRTSSYLPQARTRNLDPHHQELLDTDSHKRHCSNTALLCNCAVCYTPTSRMSLQKEQPQYFQQNICSPEVQLQNTLRHVVHFNRHGTCVILNKI